MAGHTLRACKDTGREPDKDCRRSSSGSCCTTCSSVSCLGCESLARSISAWLLAPPDRKQHVKSGKSQWTCELKISSRCSLKESDYTHLVL